MTAKHTSPKYSGDSDCKATISDRATEELSWSVRDPATINALKEIIYNELVSTVTDHHPDMFEEKPYLFRWGRTFEDIVKITEESFSYEREEELQKPAWRWVIIYTYRKGNFLQRSCLFEVVQVASVEQVNFLYGEGEGFGERAAS
ncbi:hypothetical protein OG426_54880 (plasmid) [Streptomyces canus]|uniref:hypothetical protein n=1 Tax=Streptomyces canus TaxID=58343 RepID=UPI002F90F820|nr:hypothetical protein OG426_54880 [Streptomyces canus]